MSAVSSHALATLVRGKAEGEMVWVRVVPPYALSYEGRLLLLFEHWANPQRANVTIESSDGAEVEGIPLDWIDWVDVRPFSRCSGYVGQAYTL